MSNVLRNTTKFLVQNALYRNYENKQQRKSFYHKDFLPAGEGFLLDFRPSITLKLYRV